MHFLSSLLLLLRLVSFLWIAIVVLQQVVSSCQAYEPVDGRFSFSLSTFDKSGHLSQVERAGKAAGLGTPLVAWIPPSPPLSSTSSKTTTTTGTTSSKMNRLILLASPQVLPPFIHDDGTARWVQVTPEIVLGHSGLAADGRVLTAAAQRLAVEHEYTYDEPIPIQLLLEELSLLMQKYTMKPGCRPFGSTLIVADVSGGTTAQSQQQPQPQQQNGGPRLFRVDPSGTVSQSRNHWMVIAGDTALQARLEDGLASLHHQASSSSSSMTETVLDDAQARQALAQSLQPLWKDSTSTHQHASSESRKELSESSSPWLNKEGRSWTVVGSLTPNNGLEVERIPQ